MNVAIYTADMMLTSCHMIIAFHVEGWGKARSIWPIFQSSITFQDDYSRALQNPRANRFGGMTSENSSKLEIRYKNH